MVSDSLANGSSLSILSDQPDDEDQLNFGPYAKTLADIIADPNTDTPLTIGIFGGWGRGKTSLMRMVERRLDEHSTAKGAIQVRSVRFNAWLYSHQESLWRALISRVLSGAREFPKQGDAERTELDRLEARLYKATTPLAGHLTLPAGVLADNLGGASLPPLMGLELLRRLAQHDGDTETATQLERIAADVQESEALTRRDQISALDDFRREFEDLSKQCIENHGRLAIFVDDLDRCLPERAVEVLEAVKLFLDVRGCIFVLGVAKDVIEEGIHVRYQDYETKVDGAQYLEKIIQIPFNLPPIARDAVQRYVRKITEAHLPDRRCEEVFAVGLDPNPRRIKRTLNIFTLLWRLAQNDDELRQEIKPVRLAKIIIIQQYHPKLFRVISEQGAHYLIDLEKRFREQEEKKQEADAEEKSEAGEISAGALQPFLGNGLLRALLICHDCDQVDANFSDLDPEGVSEYIYLTRSTVEEPTEPPLAGEEPSLPFEPQMVTIPAGSFLMGTPESEATILNEVPQREVSLKAYAIGRYPVTNGEFRRFADDGGYKERSYWTDAGWTQKESGNWNQPRFWDDDDWNDAAQPVVGISWYEALAYCNWLAAKTGKAYRLPTEAEWEKAARGTDGRQYPWGDAWEPERCNNRRNGPDRTTLVGQHPSGDSPFGVGDMAGQVWEWCSSKFGGASLVPTFGYPYDPDDGREDLKGDDTRVLRGGSWLDGADACRCSHRFRYAPQYGDYNRGFRCARSIP